jgi:hypothetical protein
MLKTFAVALLASTLSVELAQAAAGFSLGMAREGYKHTVAGCTVGQQAVATCACGTAANGTSRYRRPLTATEYGKLQSVITRIRAAHHSWSVLAYNCNDFVAEVAHGMGMQSPMTLLLPYDFIPTLQVINEHTLHPVAAPKFARITENRR